MGKCSKCGKKIEYNRFETIKDKPYCLECAKKVKKSLKRRLKRKKLTEPSNEAKKAMEDHGMAFPVDPKVLFDTNNVKE